MKVAVHKNEVSVLSDPVKGFPFSHLDHEVVGDPAEADWVYAFINENPDTSHSTASAEAIMRSVEYHRHPEKYVTWCLADFPHYSLSMAGVKFLLSPMDNPRSRELNCHPMPVHPCPADYKIAMDRAYTEECRSLEKINHFAFLGKVETLSCKKYGGRVWMREVAARVKKFFIRAKGHNALYGGWETAHREWMQRVGESAYGFCPISGADATMDPRFYWTMQVGTVPIITQHESIQTNFLAFQDVVDWKKLAVFVPTSHKITFPYDQLPMPGSSEYEEMRQAVIHFWDEWCHYPACARQLAKHYLSRTEPGAP